MRLRSTLRLPLALSAAWLLLGTGCFTEPVDSGSGTEGTCELGQPTCECLEGTCVAGYECNDANRCIGENCNPGEEGCSCAVGDCLPGLDCLGGICLNPGSTTVTTTATSLTDTTTMSTVTDSTTTSSQTDSTTTTNTTVAESTTEAPMTTTAGDSSSTTGMPESCAEEDSCISCFDCALENECAGEFSVCETDCIVAADCMSDCAVDGLCFDDCCEGLDAPTEEAALALHACREGTCILGACESFSNPICN